MKTVTKFIIAVLIVFVMVAYGVCRVFLTASGIVSGDFMGFAVDEEELLYIGGQEAILVYRDGELVDAIDPQIIGQYRFYVDGDTLVVAHQKIQQVKVYDLHGYYLSDSDLSYREAELTAKQKTIIRNGNEYVLENNYGFLPAKVFRNGEEIYRMPIFDFLFTTPVSIVMDLFLFPLGIGFLILLFHSKEIQQFLHKAGLK